MYFLIEQNTLKQTWEFVFVNSDIFILSHQLKIHWETESLLLDNDPTEQLSFCFNALLYVNCLLPKLELF